MSPDSEIDVGLFRAGDHNMFRIAVERYSPRILPALRTFASGDADTYDLLQEMWRRAYDKRRSFATSGTLLGWLLAIARTVGLDSVRRRCARERIQVEPEYHLGTAGPDPSEALEQRDLAGSIRRALLDLPDRERDVVILRMLEQRSTRETAAALGCAEGTVKASLHSALKKLRAPMEVWVR